MAPSTDLGQPLIEIRIGTRGHVVISHQGPQAGEYCDALSLDEVLWTVAQLLNNVPARYLQPPMKNIQQAIRFNGLIETFSRDTDTPF